MTTWWHYLLLANLYLVLFYAFYALLLKRETFFQLNRIYLVVSAALSFVLPLVQLDWVKHLFITERVENSIYQANPMQLLQISAMPDNRLTVGEIISYVYAAGLTFMLIKLCLQLIELRHVLKKSNSNEPYSFFNVVQVNQELPEHQIITAHEETHSRQWHSADRLLLEVLLIISWFNPVMYLYRRAVKHLHEFIADNEVVSAGTSKKHYAQLLVKQAFMAPAHQLTNTFYNNSLLKQRIIMLQKNKSKQVALVKYGLSAPLFAAMLVLSSATLSKAKFVIRINEKTNAALAAPAATAGRLMNKIAVEQNSISVVTGIEHAIAEPDKGKAAHHVTATDTVPAGNKSEVFTEVEQTPEPEGGMQGFYQYMGKYVRYPAEARNNKIEGRVIVQFIVEKDGSLSNVSALRGPGHGLDEEAARVVAASPKWKPGRQNGKPVRTQFTIPVQFSLASAGTSSSTSTTPVTGQPSSSQNLNEVQVVGYESSNQPAGLKGKITQVVVTPKGERNDTSAITLKITGSKPAPLYILDGKELKGMNSIDPSDIQSIDVIKDKAALAKYGNKGVNGVVIITSKHKP